MDKIQIPTLYEIEDDENKPTSPSELLTRFKEILNNENKKHADEVASFTPASLIYTKKELEKIKAMKNDPNRFIPTIIKNERLKKNQSE